ncbi:hypothetical protein BCIN_01g07130 [Botrytis cinerea B05.10]|uniref:Uncharacterized protein n=1 Tax=Botryotinia fuckeliana (strain B05.10) TaxID=332648 RepID=A0A384J603_BOTFB|nr:hypothetical protein BCIN_01g07130 [Botrytis cinerea B05.10]ATZ46036.1 hypothetical protein BCIN_01g07130 [Botrytis cinerea B05.10]
MPSPHLQQFYNDKRSFSQYRDGGYSQNEAEASRINHGSQTRGTKTPNLSQGPNTEREETTNDVNEVIKRRHVVNKETDEIIQLLNKKVDTCKEQNVALETKVNDQDAEIERLNAENTRLREENNPQNLRKKVSYLEEQLEHRKAEIGEARREKSNLQGLLRNEKAKTEAKISEADKLEKEKAKLAQDYQALLANVTSLKAEAQIAKIELSTLENSKLPEMDAVKQGLERDLDEANRNLSSEVKNGESLQSKLTAEIARAQELGEEKKRLESELEDEKKQLDVLRESIRAIAAFGNVNR